MARTRMRAGAVWIAVFASAWAALWPRTIPSPQISDRGTFVSVAERLVAGDRLYVDVWDNKDPLFYFANAAARTLGPAADLALEVTWLAIAVAAVGSLLATLNAGHLARRAIPLLATPAVLTGYFYFAGHTHLPGIAVALAAIAATAGRRYARAGVLLGLVIGLKVTIAPVAAVAIIVLCLARREPRGMVRGGVGLIATVGVIIAALAVRGELAGYVTVLRGNVGYADPAWLAAGGPAWLAHLNTVASPHTAACITATIVALAISAPGSLRAGSVSPSTALWWAAAASLVATAGVLAATAYWSHHAQALYLPALLSLTLAAARPSVLGRSGRGWRAIAGLLLALGVFLSSGASGPSYLKAAHDVPRALSTLMRPTPLTEAVLALGPKGSYARIGQNDTGTAFGLRTWRLVCPRFHQYPFDPPTSFAATLACLPSADVIVVADDAAKQDGQPDWNSFLDGAARILAHDYVCTDVVGGRVCSRRAP